MSQQGTLVSTGIFYQLLQWCIKKRDVTAGRNVYSLILREGFESSAFLGSHLIRMFGLFGSLLESNQVFCKVTEPTVFTWSSIIIAHVQCGKGEQAVKLYQQMQQSGVKANEFVFVAVLKACTSAAVLTEAHLIHGHIIESGFESNMFVGNALVNVYVKCGSLEDALKLFENMPKRDVVTWNTMITGYTEWGCIQEALVLFQFMQQEDKVLDNVTFVSILNACSSTAALDQGKLIHGLMLEKGFGWDVFVGSSLIDMYVKCRSIEDAQMVFNNLPKRDVVIWSALIAGYAQGGHVEEAFQLFLRMQQHGIEPNNALWNTLIAGYAYYGQGVKALCLFQKMQQMGLEPDSITLISILKACSSMDAVDQGKLIHAHISKSGFESDVYVGSALIDMYVKCGMLADAEIVFVKLPLRDVAAWNAMITGCYLHEQCDKATQLFREMHHQKLEPDIVTWNALIEGNAEHGNGQEALQLLQRMQQAGVKPDDFTYASILKACAGTSALSQGMFSHAHIIESGFEADTNVRNALITMYANCGSLEDACVSFDRLPNREVVTWNAMISGCVLHNDCELALHYLEGMQRECLKADDSTFVSLLSACSCSGQLEKGCHFFKAMRKDHDIFPTNEHYNCMADLFGRAGCLTEAEYLLQTMPFQPNIVSWTSLLNNCKSYGNVELGRRCFDKIFLESHKYASWYVLMENIYGGAGMCMEAHEIQELKNHTDSWKRPGKASVEIDSKVHEFVVGDKSHPKSDTIYTKLKRLCVQIEEALMPCLDSVLHPMNKENNF